MAEYFYAVLFPFLVFMTEFTMIGHFKTWPYSIHYANMSLQYTAIFHGYKNDYFQTKNCNIFLIFAQNIECLSEAVLTSTHNQCFGAKIRKNVYPCKPQFYYIKVGCKGVFVTRTCFRDVQDTFTYFTYFTST